ncbi:MAG: bifunctional phosphoserine phosphatase/homoserine phosphotransferase ThrH [Bacteroidota bacterium]|nr:bifunctional phosphoserine phosphatase/homoserine phosphotransferase ThrH [Bacteroidota bacterium]
MKQHKLKLSDIQQITNNITPLPGAVEMIPWIRSVYPFFIVSDTFSEIASSLSKKLGSPPLLCHTLETDEHGYITNYHLRSKDFKRKVVQAFQDLNFRVTAIGDSYNDLQMLEVADRGILFNPPADIQNSSSGLVQTFNYKELQSTVKVVLSPSRKIDCLSPNIKKNENKQSHPHGFMPCRGRSWECNCRRSSCSAW